MYCLSWIYAIWPSDLLFGSRNTANSCMFGSISDEILLEILTRLPTESVLECRKVCKHWKALTSSPDFTRKHLLGQQSTPSILIAYGDDPQLPAVAGKEVPNHVLLINEWGPKPTSQFSLKRKINKLGWDSVSRHMLCSNFKARYYNNSGLLHFISTCPLILPCGELSGSKNPLGIASSILFNPVTSEKVVFNTYMGTIISIFYHPLAREYRVLWCRNLSAPHTVLFKILNLGSQSHGEEEEEEPCWRNLGKFSHLPRFFDGTAVLLNNEGCLHWMNQESKSEEIHRCNDSILAFNINTEKFSTMPHPGDKCNNSWKRHTYMYLLELRKIESGSGSELCLCDCSLQHQIDMWVLEDYEKQVWVKRHRILIERKLDSGPALLAYRLEPFGIHNGEMLIHWANRGVFAYNLKKGNMRKIETKHMGVKENDIKYVGLQPKSLVSFNNFEHRGLYINMTPYNC